MKKGISFSYEENGNYIFRHYLIDKSIIKNEFDPKYAVSYQKDIKLFDHPFLSWDNLSYAFCEQDEEELDDYLLNHALQDGKKTNVAVITKRKDDVINTFSKDYNIISNKLETGYHQMFVARKGCLADYFDGDELEDYYDSLNVPYKEGTFNFLLHSEMIDLFSGKVCFNTNIPYSPLMKMDGSDGIAACYGSAAGLISGLLFGYPVESSISLVNNGTFFHGNFV